MPATFTIRVVHTQGIERAEAYIEQPMPPWPLRVGESVQIPAKDDWLKLHISQVTHVATPETYRIVYGCMTWQCDTEDRYREALDVLRSTGFTVTTKPDEGVPDVPPQP